MFLLAKPYLTFHKDTQFAMNMSVLLHIFLIVTNVNLDLFHLLKSDIHVYMLMGEWFTTNCIFSLILYSFFVRSFVRFNPINVILYISKDALDGFKKK